jgi:hypothetical protein
VKGEAMTGIADEGTEKKKEISVNVVLNLKECQVHDS